MGEEKTHTGKRDAKLQRNSSMYLLLIPGQSSQEIKYWHEPKSLRVALGQILPSLMFPYEIAKLPVTSQIILPHLGEDLER